MEGCLSVSGEEIAVGCIVSIRTSLGDEFQGQIITFDRPSNILVIQEQDPNTNTNDTPPLSLSISNSNSNSNPNTKPSTVAKTSTTNNKKNIRLLKANYIKDFTLLGKADDPLDPSNCFLDLNSIQAREDAAIRQAESDAERFGVGVTAEAQCIFDALSKTLPVHWDKTVIVVMNEVRVSSPYHPENVSGGTLAANDRVKKVLELERKRLQARGTGQ